MNDTTREIGGALGVAVIGSLVSTAYASSMAGSVAGLPAPAQQAAEESLGAALMIAEQMGSAGAGLADAARQAFVDALGNGLLVGAAVAAVAAVIVAIALPARAHDAAPAEDVLAPAVPWEMMSSVSSPPPTDVALDVPSRGTRRTRGSRLPPARASA